MKIVEVVKTYFGMMTLDENDHFVAEMANFLSDITDLPANIVLWTSPQPEALAHNKYRMKVFKDRIHVATFSIGAAPRLVWSHNKHKLRLDSYEQQEAAKVIAKFSSIFIQVVDGKLDTDAAKYEILRHR